MADWTRSATSKGALSPSGLPAPTRDIELPNYQKRIVEETVNENTLVILTTGSDKTLIAAETIRRIGPPAIFFVPTVILVYQRQEALAQWTGLDVQPYSGNMYLPPCFDILVTTPQAFHKVQTDLGLDYLQWHRIKTVVFDEVHHLLRKHPYRQIALSLRRSERTPRVLGLTASFMYTIGEAKVKAALQSMCDELRITNVQTAGDDELRTSGCYALGAEPERPAEIDRFEIPPGVLPRAERKPHAMLIIFLKRVEDGVATPLSNALTKTVLQMEMEASGNDVSFQGPLLLGKSVKVWGTYAHNRALHAKEERNAMFLMYSQLEHWYEALRLLVVSWEEADFAAILFLRMFGCDSLVAKSIWPPPVQDFITSFWRTAPSNFPRLDRLREVLLKKVHEVENFRGLLFVEQRVTTHVVEFFICNDPALSKYFTTACLYGSSTPATPSFSVSKTQASERLKAFAAGHVNLLITVIVVEEGLDVPAVNCVIRFDATQCAVSTLQGRGHAVQEKNCSVAQSERAETPTTVPEGTEIQQSELIQRIEVASQSDLAYERRLLKQRSREANATNSLYGALDRTTAMSKLQKFCKITKVPIEFVHNEKENGSFETIMTYKSLLRNVVAHGLGTGKNASKQAAAVKCVTLLRDEMERNP